MIRVTIELVPFGLEPDKRLLGQFEVWNDGTGTRQVGNYAAEDKITGDRFKIRHHPRGKGAWRGLIARLLGGITWVEQREQEPV